MLSGCSLDATHDFFGGVQMLKSKSNEAVEKGVSCVEGGLKMLASN